MEIQKSPYEKQIQDLLNKEKLARLNSETTESLKIVEQIIRISYELKEFKRLFELAQTIASKRGQAKQVQNALVSQCMKYLNQITDQNIKIDFIKVLKQICDKKIHLEVEYARCCLMLVKIKEDEQEIDEAAQILQDVQVETYATMDRREKVEFILYQMKIQLKKRDLIRLAIVSRKINTKNLNEPNIIDLKIVYYTYMVALNIHDQKYIDTAKSYQEIFDTLDKNPEIRDTIQSKMDFDFNVDYLNCLESFVLFLVLAPHSNEQVELLNDLQNNYANHLQKYPHLKNIVDSWLLNELISTDVNSYKVTHLNPFKLTTENFAQHLDFFKKQLVQHNLRVVHKYYKRIHINRLVELLNVSADVIEVEICEMISSQLIFCKIDRVDGILNFRAKRNQNEILEDWTVSLNKVLDLIDDTSNLIKREEELIL